MSFSWTKAFSVYRITLKISDTLWVTRGNVFLIGSWYVSVIVNFNALLHTSFPVYRRIWKLTALLIIKLQQEFNILEKSSKCFQTFEMPCENFINAATVVLICKTDVYSPKS